MPCEQCLNRRDFLARTAGGAAMAAAIVACGDGIVSPGSTTTVKVPPPETTGSIQIKVAHFPELATDGVLVRVASFYAAKRTGPATFDTFSMACTHEGFLVNITNGQRFDCPQHGSRFANDGSVLLGPATRPLQKLSTSYDSATDTLTIN